MFQSCEVESRIQSSKVQVYNFHSTVSFLTEIIDAAFPKVSTASVFFCNCHCRMPTCIKD